MSIQKCFDLGSRTYDDVASVQASAATILCQMIEQYGGNFSSILDIGAGTGMLVDKLRAYHPTSIYTLLDLSSSMLERAQVKFQNAPYFYILDDMDACRFSKYDLIVSNLAFQWSKNIYRLVEYCAQQSHLFAFSCLLDGSFSDWYQRLQISSLYAYPHEDELVSKLSKISYQIEWRIQEYSLTFDGGYAAMRYLKKLGAHYTEYHLPYAEIKKLILDTHEQFKLSYRVFFGVIQS